MIRLACTPGPKMMEHKHRVSCRHCTGAGGRPRLCQILSCLHWLTLLRLTIGKGFALLSEVYRPVFQAEVVPSCPSCFILHLLCRRKCF